MWIAQSFIEPHAKKSLEEVGDDYFFHLVDRCFFQDVSVDDDGYTCKMHDLIHDLAIQVAESEYSCYSTEDSREMAERSSSPHHISVTFSTDSSFDNSKLSSLSKSLRTLRLIHAENIKIDSLELVMDRFKKLRTLVISKSSCKTLPDSFGGLVHLRYLDLSKNYNLITLPNSICKLYYLQTLLLDDCSDLVSLPSNLTKLVSLRHLFLEGCSNLDSMPSEFGALTSLVSLDRLIVHPNRGGLRYLGRVDELCGMITLELPENGWTDCIEDARKANMSNKCRLRGLSTVYGRDDKKLTEKERKAIIDELQPHANLQYLGIEHYFSDKLPSWFPLLSNIKNLVLRSCLLEFIDVSVRCGYLLPHLESLELDSMQCLRGWWSEAASPIDDAPMSTMLTLPRVSSLSVTDCADLVENMPLFMVVEELQLKYVNVRLVNMLLRNSDVQCSSRLQVLMLDGIKGLECLPESLIKHLTALKIFSILSCDTLSRVSRRGLACLTSLEELTIRHAYQRVRLEDEDADDKKVPYTNYGLESVRKLEVHWQSHLLQEGLHCLTSLLYVYSEEQQVEADNQDLECERAMRWQLLEKLQQVTLNIKWMNCCFPTWVLQLPCLRDLKLESCGVMDVDDWVAQQTLSNNLVSLTIDSWSKESLWLHDIPWKLLPSLRELRINSTLSTIPDGIQSLNSLQRLKIHCVWKQEINEIPKWMINLTSLQHLKLSHCSPELVIRCKPETGADWHLISHIPDIKIHKYDTESEDEE